MTINADTEVAWLYEREKQYYVQELHDTVLQEQIACARALHELMEEHITDAVTMQQQLEQLYHQQQEIIYMLRTYCSNLQAPTWLTVPLRQAVEQLVNVVELQTNIEVSLSMPLSVELTSEREIQLYRIVQELFHNAIKHSKASRLTLSIEKTRKHWHMHYTDNGVGIENIEQALALHNHFGLKGIYYRSKLLGGKLNMESSHNSGYILKLTIPQECS